jgi:NAD(P)-dependent dehydrogenase (short-subunit alcohol dehydrogenase family)
MPIASNASLMTGSTTKTGHGTVALSGSASGIGHAVRARFEGAGQRVIGVDLRDAEVLADLASPAGRAAATDGVLRACGRSLDGVVACAGLGPEHHDTAGIVSVNYFGAVAFLEGLRDVLGAGRAPAAVAVSSNSATLSPGADGPLAAACLAGDEAEARRLAADGTGAYASSKLALARFVRRQATGARWAGAGIRLNAVAPGATLTPLLQRGLDHPRLGAAIRGFPIPLGGFGEPERIASAIAFLLGPDAAFCCGTVLFVDGGSDALLRPDAL